MKTFSLLTFSGRTANDRYKTAIGQIEQMKYWDTPLLKTVQAKRSSHKDFQKMQEPTHEESNNMKMEMERRCVENQTAHSG